MNKNQCSGKMCLYTNKIGDWFSLSLSLSLSLVIGSWVCLDWYCHCWFFASVGEGGREGERDRQTEERREWERGEREKIVNEYRTELIMYSSRIKFMPKSECEVLHIIRLSLNYQSCKNSSLLTCCREAGVVCVCDGRMPLRVGNDVVEVVCPWWCPWTVPWGADPKLWVRPLRGEGGVNPTPEEPEGTSMAGEGERERRVGEGE